MGENAKMSLTAKVLVGMVLGILVGLLINVTGLNAPGSFINEFVVNGLFHVVGKLFVNALKMLVVPLVLFSLICGVCGIGNLNTLGRVGSKAFLLYIMTTAIAIATAILFAASAGIGQGMGVRSDAAFTGKEAPPLTDVFINIIPGNPIAAMVNGEMLQVIFFAILVGVSLLMVGRKAKSFIAGAEIGNEIMMKMVGIVMAAAPYAVFALIAKSMAELGLDLLAQLAGYVLV
ncbi:dicarboxylate/amino acid:cation symporter, partial [Thiothrix nivea]|uniref:dicarboxylate/amino acid:cation symporter n=1 Tax=Thiothrix nivea TaxID=1031 RepID=UPI0002FF1149